MTQSLPNNTGVSVGITSSKILVGNGGRNALTLTNSGSYDIYVSKGSPAVVGQGIYLVAGGGAHTFTANNDGKIFQGDIYAIANGGSSNLCICEEYN